MTDPAPSNSQVNKAGRLLRKAIHPGPLPSAEQLLEAVAIANRWRDLHREPLHAAYMGLSSGCVSRALDARVTQRLKRWPTIVDKLTREPTLQLANMQDVGGCRAVLPSLADVRKLEAHLRRYHSGKLDLARCRDYVAMPRSSGYRAVHLIVFYSGRRIEWQLRTVAMHEWAMAVERLGPLLGDGNELKSGRGPAEVHDWLILVSQAMAFDENDQAVPPDLVADLQAARVAALASIERAEGR